MKKFFEMIIERYAKYDNLDTAMVINDVVNSLTFRA